MGALWRLLGLLHLLVCATRVLQWGSKKRPKQFEINGLGMFFCDPFGETNLDHSDRNTFPCSAALVLDLRKAFSCSVALVFGFLMFPWVVQHGPARASEICINLMEFYICCKNTKNDGAPEADAKD